MSDYSTGEAALLTIIQGLADFDGANTSRGNAQILSSGASTKYAILKPGPFERRFTSVGNTVRTTWRTIVVLYEQYQDDGTTQTALETDRQSLIGQIDKYFKLSATAGVLDAFVTAGGDVQVWGSAPAYLVQELEVTWLQEGTVTLVDS